MQTFLFYYTIIIRFFGTVFFCISCSFAVTYTHDATEESPPYRIIVIPVSGDVDPAMAAFIARALRDTPPDDHTRIVLEMDTFGGRIDAALQIVDTLSALPSGTTIAYVKNKAISAGSLIALACSRLAMRHNTTIGDCAPITYSNDGPQMLGEKFQSPLRARFRALAKRNNYPALLAESMVSADIAVYKVSLPDTALYVDSSGLAELTPRIKKQIITTKTIVKQGELLTMDDQEARELGFSFSSVNSIEEMLDSLHINNYTIVRIVESWSEKFAGFIGTIAPILLMIGFAALYMEIKTPGFGIFGIVGVICLALVFGSQYMVGLANYTELIIIMFGVVLLAVELFVIPGFGIVGISGILLIAVGMLLSLQDFVIPKPEMPWQKELLEINISKILISLSGAVVILVLFFKFVFPRLSALIPGPYLSATLAGSYSTPESMSAIHVGDAGIVAKTLRPSGQVRCGDQTYDAITEGDFINAGESVVITDIRGNHIVVMQGTEQ